jgi:hypothetical protein
MVELWTHAQRIVDDGAAAGKVCASPAAVRWVYGVRVMRFIVGGATGELSLR